MKRTTTILILAVTASAAWAQAPAAATGNAKAAAVQINKAAVQTPAAGTPAKSAPVSAKPAATQTAAKPATEKKAAAAVKPAANKPAAEPAKPAAPAPAAPAPEMSNAKKRDPFVSPIVSKVGGPVNCSGGKKCLVVDQIALRGVVRSNNGMIAVVVNGANKAYFMRENDPIYNGFVVKITPDSIVFRETVTDKLGKPLSREIVKKVNAPVV